MRQPNYDHCMEDLLATRVDDLTEDDQVFRAFGDHRTAVACLNFGNAEHGYVTGFLLIANLAVEHAATLGRAQDSLVYPIVYGYRHYLELRTKGLLRDLSSYFDRPAPPDSLMTRHRLVPIWKRLEPLLTKAFPDGAVQLSHVGRCIMEFEELDPLSVAFRYVTTKEGRPTLPPDLRNLDLANLRAVVGKVAHTLDVMDMAVSSMLDVLADYRQYMAEPDREAKEYYSEEGW